MKLASFEVASRVGRTCRVGVLIDGRVVDVTATYAKVLERDCERSPSAVAEAVAPPDMTEFLERGNCAMDAARQVISFISETRCAAGLNGAQLTYDFDEIRLLSPVPRPNSIRDYSTFEAHRAHFDEGDTPDIWYERPLYTRRNHNSIVHPGEDVARPVYTEEFDFELELAAVIGKEARDVPADEADAYIAGYTIYNDFSARDVQRQERELGKQGRGKSPLNAFGPVLVTTDTFDVAAVRASVRVNDEVWQDGRTGTMQHTFRDIVAYLSASETLYPGEIICSGTIPGGSGTERGLSLQPGDAVELEVEGIGVLANRIVEPEET